MIRKSRKILRELGQDGFDLMSLSIAGGVIAFLALVMSTLMSTMLKSNKNIEIGIGFQQTVSVVSALLNETRTCTGNLKLATNLSSQTFQKIPDATLVIDVGAIYFPSTTGVTSDSVPAVSTLTQVNPGIRVDKLQITKIRPIDPPSYSMYSAVLRISATKTAAVVGAPTLHSEIPMGIYVNGPDGSGNMNIVSCANTSVNFSQICTGLGGVWDTTRTPSCQLSASTSPPAASNCSSEPQFSGGLPSPTLTCLNSATDTIRSYNLSCYWDIGSPTVIVTSPPTGIGTNSIKLDASGCINNDITGSLLCCHP